MPARSGSTDQSVSNPNGIGLFRLVATVITLIVGGGVYTLAGDMAAGGASGAAIMTAWGISGVGVLCLTLTFYALSRVKPRLKGGIYSYACAGFGRFLGFTGAWGYWISALLATVSFAALLFAALGYFFPIFGNGHNVYSLIGASIFIWFYVFLVSRGITEVTGINAVITISKLVPIFVAIIAIILVQKFNPDIFIANMQHGGEGTLSFGDQINSVLMVTLWVFVGVEGAIAISGRAKYDNDVGKATIIAFCCVLVIYVMVCMLSMGVMPLSDLAELDNPSMAGVMQEVVGPWGAILINGGVALSLVGSLLGYTVLSCESPYEAATQGVFIKAFAKTNKNGAPIVTLIVTNVIVEFFLIVMTFNNGTYQFFYKISAGMILLPYLLSAAYLLKLTFKEPEVFADKIHGHIKLWRTLAFVGVLYSFLLGYVSGPIGLTIMSFLYAPGILVYMKGKKERGERCFETKTDKIIVAVILIATVVSLYLVISGQVF